MVPVSEKMVNYNCYYQNLVLKNSSLWLNTLYETAVISAGKDPIEKLAYISNLIFNLIDTHWTNALLDMSKK